MDERALQNVLDREIIREIRCQYAECLDYKRWADLENLFTEEIETDFTLWGIAPQKMTAAAFANSFKTSLGRDGLKTQHIFSNFRVTVDGDTATCKSYMFSQHYLPGFEGGEEYFLRAEYVDQLTRTADGWKISGVTLAAIFYATGNQGLLSS